MSDRLGNTRSPNLAEVLHAATQRATEDMFVAMPASIAVYDAATQTADVQPMVKRPVVFDDGSDDTDELPIIPGVPVVFPRGGNGFFISFPMQPGDLVLLVFCDRSIDKYKTSGGTVPTNPVDLRSNDISDAVAIPGFYPLTKALKDGPLNAADMALGFDGGVQIRFKMDGSCEVSNATGSLTLGADGSISGASPAGDFELGAAGTFTVNGGNLEVLP